MRRILLCGLGSVAMSALLLSGIPAGAEVINMKADLKGSSEVPPNQSAGTGAVTATFDTADKKLSWNGNFSGMSGNPTAAHFHGPAEPGKNAGVAVPISKAGTPFTSPFEGSATLTDAQAAQVMAGQWYVNIHTAANPGGELRGQLIK